jgi:nucleotidyltransferase substrate binding protein (TIGR01987 family)
MIEDAFDLGDLYGLEACLRDLDEMLARSAEAKDDKAVRYALIKTFELTYEMSIKSLRKYLIAKSTKSEEAATFDFQDLIRLADQYGLVRAGWPEWKRFRESRSRTVHTYGEAVALQISTQLKEFSAEAHTLLSNLRERLEGSHG